MKQKLNDLALLIKNDRKYQWLLAVGVIGVGWALMHDGSHGPTRTAKPKTQTVGTGSSSPDEAYKDIVTAFKHEVDDLKNDSKQTKAALEETRKEMEENVKSTGAIFKRVIERMEENANNKQSAAPGSGGPGTVDVSGDPAGVDQMANIDNANSQGVEEFGNQPVVAPPPPPANNIKKIAFIGAGDTVRGKLIAAVDAPTDGTPYPVLFKLISNVDGPDQSNLPIGEARVIAAAQGSLTDSRVLFRITSLNVRYPDGRRKVVDVDGWVVGEDGIRGMEGVLIDPIGKAIGATMMAGGLSGLGDAVSAKQVKTTTNLFGGQTVDVTGSEGEFALGRALSGGANAWSRLVENRVNRLVPHVQVLSGREATIVFAKNVELPGLYEAISSEEDVFSSVD